MSNANSEYNVLAVLPWNAGVVSWFMFFSFGGFVLSERASRGLSLLMTNSPVSHTVHHWQYLTGKDSSLEQPDLVE